MRIIFNAECPAPTARALSGVQSPVTPVWSLFRLLLVKTAIKHNVCISIDSSRQVTSKDKSGVLVLVVVSVPVTS
jgi:hypothetical protein